MCAGSRRHRVRSHKQPGGGHAKVVYRGLAWPRDGCVSPPCPTPSPFLTPGGCLAGAHAGEQSPLRVACACVSSCVFPCHEQPGGGRAKVVCGNLPCARAWFQASHLAHEQRVPHSLQYSRMAGFAAEWPTGALQAPHDMLEQMLRISPNLVFDQCSVFAVFPLCPPSLSSPLSWTWRLSRWRTRRRAVLSLCCVCVCFLPVHHVHRAARIHCSFHAWLGLQQTRARGPLAHFRHP